MGRPKKNHEKSEIKSDVSTNVENDKYIIVGGNRTYTEMMVDFWTDKGYICQGGVSVVTWQGINGREFLYSQAMLKV